MAHLCVTCTAPLEPEDGHDSCPPCLGLEHLREGLTASACMNCSPLPGALRLARLAGVEQLAIADDPSVLTGLSQHLPGRSRLRFEDDASHTLGEASLAQSSLQGAEDTSMAGITRVALARFGLDAPQTDPGQASAFFRRNPVPSTFTVPPLEEYDAAQVGLGRMPPVEPAIASLILAPDETLRPDARCPRPQCRVMDDLLTKAYDSAARMGRIGNSLSHLLLGLSTSLQQAQVEPALQSLSDASLQAFALMSRELGRTMSTLVQTRRQVWLAQSPLTETCRKVLRAVPVEPGELFGAAALEALEMASRARQTRQELSGLHRNMSTPSRPRGPLAVPRPPAALSASVPCWPTEVSAACSTVRSTARGGVSGPRAPTPPWHSRALQPNQRPPPEPQEAEWAGVRPMGSDADP
ncbi:unnamed protein product [Boreogadus saida]